MKLLFFLLLTVNIGLFMWEFKTGALDSKQKKAQLNQPVVREPIRLASEVTQAPPVTPTEQEPETAQPPAENTVVTVPDKPTVQTDQDHDQITWYCYDVGPFASRKSFIKWQDQLTGLNSEIQMISKDEPVASKFMVYYPAAVSLSEAQANVQMLKNQGLKDVLLLTDKEQKWQISLGVFSREERAMALKTQLLGKDINTQIKPLYKTVAQKYARIKSNTKIMEDLERLTTIYPQFTVKPIDVTAEDCR